MNQITVRFVSQTMTSVVNLERRTNLDRYCVLCDGSVPLPGYGGAHPWCFAKVVDGQTIVMTEDE